MFSEFEKQFWTKSYFLKTVPNILFSSGFLRRRDFQPRICREGSCTPQRALFTLFFKPEIAEKDRVFANRARNSRIYDAKERLESRPTAVWAPSKIQSTGDFSHPTNKDFPGKSMQKNMPVRLKKSNKMCRYHRQKVGFKSKTSSHGFQLSWANFLLESFTGLSSSGWEVWGHLTPQSAQRKNAAKI